MTLESLDKLRKYKLLDEGKTLSAYIPTDKIIDEIQAELESRFMELPLDADGVPIHVGDWMCSAGIREKGHKVMVSAIFDDGFVEYGSENGFIGPLHQEDWVHVNPRTVEDVLLDFLRESRSFNLKRDGEVDEAIAKYAAELRMRDE